MKTFLSKSWNKLFGEPAPSHFDLVPISSCREDFGNDILLLFINSGKAPKFVAKISRKAQYGFKIKKEYKILTALRNEKRLHPYIPTVFFFGTLYNRPFLIENAIEGTALFDLIRLKGLSKVTEPLIKQAVEILVDISLVENCADNKLSLQKDNYFPIGQFENAFLQAGISQDRLNECIAITEKFVRFHGKFFTLHGDYWGANILVDRERNKVNGIIDWEFASVRSPIPSDIIWFLINLAYALYGSEQPGISINAAFERLLSIYDREANIFSWCYEYYMESVGVIGIPFSLLCKMSLLEFAVRELKAYGKAYKMDRACLQMLAYLIENEC